MGLIVAEVLLINGDDLTLARKNIIGQEDVKQMNVSMLVDTGAYSLCINEEIQKQLQFPVVGK